MVAKQIQRGATLPSGSLIGIDVAYLPTDRDLGVILEIFSHMPGAGEASDPSANE